MDKVFVSMPFDDRTSKKKIWTKLYNYGLKPLEKKIPGIKEYQPITLLKADQKFEDIGLKNHVINLIEESTFTLSVFKTSESKSKKCEIRLSSPNVLWEMGYAEAIGKPVVVLCDIGSKQSLPVLAGSPNIIFYDHSQVKKLISRGEEKKLKIIARDLEPYISLATVEGKLHTTCGIRLRANAYANRDKIHLLDMISKASEDVNILTTNLHYYFVGKFQFEKKEDHPFARAIKNGATVRIVTMDPESVFTEYRAKQLGRGHDIPGYRKELRDGIVRFYEWFGDNSEFHLHIYNDLPLQITARIDQNIITSIVTRGDRARKRIQILFNAINTGVTESFLDHFQSVFYDSKDVHDVAWVLRHNHKPVYGEEMIIKK